MSCVELPWWTMLSMQPSSRPDNSHYNLGAAESSINKHIVWPVSFCGVRLPGEVWTNVCLSSNRAPAGDKRIIPPKSIVVNQRVYWGYFLEHRWPKSREPVTQKPTPYMACCILEAPCPTCRSLERLCSHLSLGSWDSWNYLSLVAFYSLLNLASLSFQEQCSHSEGLFTQHCALLHSTCSLGSI